MKLFDKKKKIIKSIVEDQMEAFTLKKKIKPHFLKRGWSFYARKHGNYFKSSLYSNKRAF